MSAATAVVIEPNMISVLVATVVCFFFSYIWYTPLFGQRWAREMNLPDSANERVVRGMAITFVGTFMITFVLANNIIAWTPSTWGLVGQNMPFIAHLLSATIFTWIGFFVPTFLSDVAWAKHSWALFFINAGHAFFTLLIAASILLAWPMIN